MGTLKAQSIVHCLYITHLQQAPGGEEWEEWGQMEEFSVKVEPSSNSQQIPVDKDLFHDMTPVFQKPKKVSKNFTHMYAYHINYIVIHDLVSNITVSFFEF